MRGYSYEELAFHLSDSQAYRAFCRFEVVGPPLKRSTLQENVALLSPATWEKLNEIVVARAKATGIESGKKVRVDCTPVESNNHAPTDSSLLWDIVRVLGRSLETSLPLLSVGEPCHPSQVLGGPMTLAIGWPHDPGDFRSPHLAGGPMTR
jgi:IS5 family transposase